MAENETSAEGPLTASVEKLRHELDRWLEFAVTQGEKAMEAIRPRCTGTPWTPPVDVLETDEDVVVVVDLPGPDPKSIDVSLAGNMLTLSGEKPATPTAEEQTLHTSERPRGRFSRSIPMPVPVDPEALSAEARDGVLRIRLGKSARAKVRPIQVNVGGESTGAESAETGTG